MTETITISLSHLNIEDLAKVHQMKGSGKLSPLICELLHNHFLIDNPLVKDKKTFDVNSDLDLATLEIEYSKKNPNESTYLIKGKFATLKEMLKDKKTLKLAWLDNKLLIGD